MVAANSEGRPGFSARLKTALPIIQWLPSYRGEWFGPDRVAGLTLAVPVAVAYSSLAGLPSQAGLYCYLLGGVAYALFGTSRQLAIKRREDGSWRLPSHDCVRNVEHSRLDSG
jgi:hypothetical protein